MPKETKKSVEKTNKSTKSTRGQKGGISKTSGMNKTATTAAAGAAIGAAIGGVAGAALSTDKAQAVVNDVVSNLGEYAQGAIEAMQENKAKLQETTKTVAADAMNKAGKK